MRNGSRTCAINPTGQASRSSSNNGAGCRKNATAGNSMVAPGMKCRLPGSCCRLSIAQLRHGDRRFDAARYRSVGATNPYERKAPLALPDFLSEPRIRDLVPFAKIFNPVTDCISIASQNRRRRNPRKPWTAVPPCWPEGRNVHRRSRCNGCTHSLAKVSRRSCLGFVPSNHLLGQPPTGGRQRGCVTPPVTTPGTNCR